MIYNKQKIRKGCKDIWNASYLREASFGKFDIPFCPTTAKGIPEKIITFEDALNIHHQEMKKKHRNYSINAFVIFSIDDYKFDKGINSIWEHVESTIKILKHYKGIITPDFSTYIDFPEPLKLYNTYRMRAFGYIAGKYGLEVINNVRWDSSNNYAYCFEGIPRNTIVAIGTVASQLKLKENRPQFEGGFWKMVETLQPQLIIVYGSSNYHCFLEAEQKGIHIKTFPSSTAEYYRGKKL